MARRLIGLDVGTNAVTIAEVTPGTPPRLDMFAQVALPREAMREGEIADEAAVTDAVARLRSEVGLKKASVRVGIASRRVVVRQVEMPVMTRDELASALQFQAADLIPIPIEDAVLDFAILGQGGPSDEGGEPTMQVLLAAAYESTLLKLVAAVEAGGFQVGAVDLVPLALTRALARPAVVPVAAAAGGVMVEDGIGAEAIVSFGGGVTAIAVHEFGVPRFVRVLGSGGRELTDAIATDLDVPSETAEALKRALSNPAPDEMVIRARNSVDRPLSVLLDEVRSSIDYYRNQPGAARLGRVVVTGGSAQLPGLPERLSALVGVPVEPAYMHDLLRIGDIGFPADELPRLEPYLPAPVGLALGGAGNGTVIDLLPRTRKSSSRVRSKIDQRVLAAAIGGIVVFGGLTYMAHGSASSAKSKQKAAETAVTKLQNQIGNAQLANNPAGGGSSSQLQAEGAAVLANDTDWPGTINGIFAKLPSGVKISTLQGSRTVAPTPVAGAAAVAGSTTKGAAASTTSGSTPGSTPAASSSAPAAAGAPAPGSAARAGLLSGAALCASVPVPTGTVQITGVATSLPELAAFIDALKDDHAVTQVWVSSAQHSTSNNQLGIQFSLTAQLDKGARGHRLESFLKEDPCK